MEYLLKVCAIALIFYTCYKLFLQRETFFQSNRWFLLTGLIVSFIIPLIVIPIYVQAESTPLQYIITDNIPSSSEVLQVKEAIDIIWIIKNLYIAGVLFFLGRFIIQFSSLGLLLFKNNKTKKDGYIYTETNNDTSPFSFFNWIVYNPTQFNNEELDQIITHEKIHARELHSIDIVLIQCLTIICWFNPFIWLYKKELQQNLEFIADQNTQQKIVCKKSYQHLLIKASVPNYQIALTNNFYNSLIKKRIVMLHKNRSQKKKQWKFILVLPILALFLMSFNTKEVIRSQEEPNTLEYSLLEDTINDYVVDILITKNTTDNELKEISAKYKEKDIHIKFKNVKRNDAGDIVKIDIKASFNDSNANYNTQKDEGIEAIKITIDAENNRLSIGNAKTDLHFTDDHDVSYIIKNGKTKVKMSGKGHNSFVFSSGSDNKHVNTEIIQKDGLVIIKSGGTVHELKNGKVNINGSVYITSGDNGEVIEFKSHEHVGDDVHKHDNNHIHDEDKVYEFKTIGKKGGTKFFISNDDGKNPLFIVDGKELSHSDFQDLDSDIIKSVNVYKGDTATKKYGDKGKNGVVVIITKDKK